ncbi:MAG: cytochrome c [Gammaproteobacteria bacterium]|jgi:cytochrome c556|nr:cytochrome c [Gammaproteobacteria bacterium]
MLNKSYLWVLCLIILCPNTHIRAEETYPILHAISSKELRDIMRRMNQLVYEREMTALQTQTIHTKRHKELVDTASDLVNSTDDLTKALSGLNMEKQDQITFKAMAKQLLEEAKNIKRVAEENDHNAINSVYQDLDNTCKACHRLFRF